MSSALKPCGRGMLLETLRYADEVNKAAGYFRDIGDTKPDPDLLDLAATLIEKKAGEFDAKRVPQPLRRRAEGADRREAEEEGREGHPGPGRRTRRAKGSNVIDLMAALKKSLGDDKPSAGRAKKAAAKKARPPRRKPQSAGAQAGVSHGAARPSSTSRPTTASATSRRPTEPQGPQAQGQGRQLRRPEA